MANQKPLRFNPSTGGFKLFQGDDNFWLDYTAASGNIIDIQKSTATLFSIGNKGEAQFDVATSSAKAALTVGGRYNSGYPALTIKDLALGFDSLQISALSQNSKPTPVLTSLSSNNAAAEGFRLVAKVDADTPTMTNLLNIGYTKTDTSFQQVAHLGTAGALYLDKTSGADILWSTNASGSIGSSGGNKPANVYANTLVDAAGSVLKVNALDLGPQAATDKTITALQTGTNDPKFQYKVGVGWQFTNNGTTWIPLIGASTLTWDDLYHNDSGGLAVDLAGQPFIITQTSPSTTGAAFEVTRNLASNNESPVRFTSTNAADNYPVLYVSTSSTGSGYALSLNCVGTGSIPLNITQPTNSSVYAVQANGTYYTSRSYRGGDYSDSAVFATASRTSAFSINSGRFLRAGYFEITQGTGDLATCYYAGVEVGCSPTATNAQSYGMKVDPDFRVGSHYSGTIFDQWTSVDKSAIVIDTASYATADSYGIVFTSSASAQRPSNLLASGSTAVLVNASWDYGLWTASCISATGPSTKDKAAVQVSNSTSVALAGGERRPSLRSTITGHASDPATSYADCFSAASAGTGSSLKCGFYAATSLDYGVYSDVTSWFQRTALTTDSTAVYGTVASTPPALGVNQYRNIFSSDLRGHASDAASSITAAYHAKVAGSGGTTTGGAFVGLYADHTLTYGFYSEAKCYADFTTNTNGDVLHRTWLRSSGMTLGTERIRGIVSSVAGSGSDANGSSVYLFDAEGDSDSSVALFYGYHATAKCDYGVYSEAPSVFSRYSTATDNNTIFATFNDAPTALGSGYERATYSSDLKGNASDNSNSKTSSFRANVAGGNTTGGAFIGFHARNTLTYGLYSETRSGVVHSTNTVNDYGFIVNLTSTGITGTNPELFGVRSQVNGNAGDDTDSIKYCFYAAGDTTSTPGTYYGLYADDKCDYGWYVLGQTYQADLLDPLSKGAVGSTFISAQDGETGGGSFYAVSCGLSFTTNATASIACKAAALALSTSATNKPANTSAIDLYIPSTSESDYGIFSQKRGYFTAPLGYGNYSLRATSTATALGTSGYWRSAFYVDPAAHASDVTGSMTFGIYASSYYCTGVGSGSNYGYYTDTNWTYGLYVQSASYLASTPPTGATSATTTTTFNTTPGALSGSFIRAASEAMLRGNAADNANSVTASFYSTVAGTGGTTTGGEFAGLYVTNSINRGVYSLAEYSDFLRTAGTWTGASRPVVRIENGNTATDANHALLARVSRSVAGTYAVALDNTAETGGTSETKRHIGFVSAKTNIRVIPLSGGNGGGNFGWSAPGGSSTAYWVESTTGTRSTVSIPLILPHGCALVGLTYYYNGNGTNTPFISLRYKGASTSSTWSTAFTQNGSAGPGATSTAWSGSVTIDNATNQYCLKFDTGGSTGASTCSLTSISVTYTIQDLGAAPGY